MSDFELSPTFLSVAACPKCRAKFAVDYDKHELVCTNAECGLAYPVRNGIPVLLIEVAHRPSSD